MDGFQHEAALLREVAGGLEERLSALPDWAVFRRTGLPPEGLAADPRFQAWQSSQDAIAALLANHKLAVSRIASSDAAADELPVETAETALAQVPVVAAPRRAFSQQVASVEVITRSAAPPSEQESEGTDRGTEAKSEPGATRPRLSGDDIKDDLTRVRGIDRATAKALNGLGVYRIAQIASWTPDEMARVRDGLSCGNRIARENWIERAAMLAQPEPPVTVETSLAAGQPGAIPQGTDDAQSERPDRTTADVEEGDEAAVIAARLRRIRRLPLPRFEKPTASVGVVHVAPAEPMPEVVASPPVEVTAAPEISEAAPTETTTETVPDPRPPVYEVPSPLPEPISDPLDIRGVTADDVRVLDTLGMGSTSEIAKWTATDIDRVEAALQAPGRVRREGWVEQAALLSAGISTHFAAHDRRRVERTPLVSPLAQVWTRRVVSSPVAGIVDAASPPQPEAELDQRIARLQEEVARIRNLPDFAKSKTPPRLSDRLQTVQLQEDRLSPRVEPDFDGVDGDDVPEFANAEQDWDGDGFDVEEAAVKIVAVEPATAPDANDMANDVAPSRDARTSARRAVPLEQRLQTSMTSMRQRRLERDEESSLPPPNYADTPEEASVQIIYRDRAPADTDESEAPQQPGSKMSVHEVDRSPSPAKQPGKAGLKRYLKALTGER